MVLVLRSYPHFNSSAGGCSISAGEMESHLVNKPRIKLEIQELKSRTVLFLVHPKQPARAGGCNSVSGAGRGQTSGKQRGGHSAPNLGKSFRFLKSFPNIRDKQNFPLPAAFWPLPQATHTVAAGSRKVPLGNVGSNRNCVSRSTKL